MARLQIVDNYSAVAASGFGGYDNYISVDVLPSPFDVTRDTVSIPITLLDTATGSPVVNLICTGWQQSPARLFIDVLYISDVTTSCDIICAPNKPLMECYQLAQSMGGTVDGDTYSAVHGVTHYLTISSAGTIQIEYGFDGNSAPWDNYSQVFNNGHLTRFILSDADSDQPTITWSTDYGSLTWENGSPQFTSGKTRLVVDVVGGAGALYGSFKLFA